MRHLESKLLGGAHSWGQASVLSHVIQVAGLCSFHGQTYRAPGALWASLTWESGQPFFFPFSGPHWGSWWPPATPFADARFHGLEKRLGWGSQPWPFSGLGIEAGAERIYEETAHLMLLFLKKFAQNNYQPVGANFFPDSNCSFVCLAWYFSA